MLKRLTWAFLALGLLLPSVQAQDFIRYTPPTCTLGASGCTFTVPILVPAGSAAAPSVASSANPSSGLYFSTLYPKLAANGNDALSTTWNAAFNYGIAVNGALIGTTVLTQNSIAGGKTKSLTDAAAATPYVTVAVPTNGWVAGELVWAATSVSGADQLVTTGRIRFAGATTNVTPVCTVGVIGTDLAAVSAGVNTLVCTWTNVVAAQTCALSVTCTNDLAGTQAITMNGRLDMPITATLVFP
jgi:hypothetical protein